MLHALICLLLITLYLSFPQPTSAQRLSSDVQTMSLRIFGEEGRPITWRSGEIRIVADTVPAGMRYHFEDFARDIFLPDTTISGFEFPVDAVVRHGAQEMTIRLHSGIHLDSIPFRPGIFHVPPILGTLFNIRLYGGTRILGRDISSFRVPSLDLLPEWSTFGTGTVIPYSVDDRRCDGEEVIRSTTFLRGSWDDEVIFFCGIFSCDDALRSERLYRSDNRHDFHTTGSLPSGLPTIDGLIRGEFINRDEGWLFFGDLRTRESRMSVARTDDGGDAWEPDESLTDLQIVDAAPRDRSTVWFLGLPLDDREKETRRPVLYIGDLDGENLRRVDWPEGIPETLVVSYARTVPRLAASWEGGVVLSDPGTRQSWYVPVSKQREGAGSWSVSNTLFDIDLDSIGSGWMVLQEEIGSGIRTYHSDIHSGFGSTLYRIRSGGEDPERVLTFPYGIASVHSTGPGSCLILGDGCILQTTDNGESWRYFPFDIGTYATWHEAGRGYLYGGNWTIMMQGDERELHLYTRGGIFPFSFERLRPWEG